MIKNRIQPKSAEPAFTLGQLYNVVKALDKKVDCLLEASKGSSIEPAESYPEVDSKALEELARSVKWECGEDTCTDCDLKKQNECKDYYEKEKGKGERKAKLGKRIPYSEKQLQELNHKDLVVVAGVCGINPFKLKDSTAKGLISEILKKQPKKVSSKKKK